MIIDPQVDFHPGGSLGVPGANEDSARIANFIYKFRTQISDIFVTLDSHHKMHIAHASFWTNAAGERPSPFTLIHHADIQSGVWRPRDEKNLAHALAYSKALEDNGRFVLCIWPDHCLIGTPGHAVEANVNAALQHWACEGMTSVHYVHKGMNLLTEMYSAIAADVPVPSDPSTHMNHALLSELNQYKKLVICGQALSHCVNFTTRDILAHWRGNASDIIVLTDGSSSVPGFEESGSKFLAEMKAAGVTLMKTDEFTI